MGKNLFGNDSIFSKFVTLNNNGIHIKSLLQILSRKNAVNLYNDRQYYKDYIFIHSNSVKFSFLLDSICCMYNTYWEKTNLGYALRYIANSGDSLSKSPLKEIAESFSKARETYDNMPASVRKSLNFDEGTNSTANMDSLPSALKTDLNAGLDALKADSGKSSPSVRRLLDDRSELRVGLRVTGSDDSAFERIEYQFFRGNSFIAASVADVPGKLKAQRRGMDSNNPNTKSYKIDQLSRTEFQEIKRNDEALNTLITLNLPKMYPSQIVKQIVTQVPSLNIICTAREDIKYPKFDKIAFRSFREPLHKIFDKLCHEYKYITWEVRRGNIIVIRERRRNESDPS